MKKDIKFSTRMASADREKIRALAAKAHMSMSDYVTACCLGKRIVVIDEQKELLRQLSRFPETVREAAARYEPSIVTRAVTELCKAYNKFYYENRILEEDAGVREARVRLTRAVRDTIRTGLWLIGMEAPERM